MNIQLLKLKRAAILLAGIYAASISAIAQADWSFTGLGNLLGSRNIHVSAINDSGQVAGFFSASDSTQDTRAFITGPDGVGMTDLGTFGGLDSATFDINGSGQILGRYTTDNHEPHMFITGPNGVGMIDLGPRSMSISDTATAGINDSAQVVGTDFVTGPNGVGITDLSSLVGSSGYAVAINDAGLVAGRYDAGPGTAPHAFLTGSNGIGRTDLGTLGGNFSEATGINSSGQVIGFSNTAALPHDQHAFVTGPDGIGMTDLGTLGGGFSKAFSINDSGEVVGMADTASNDSHVYIYSHGGITDLTLLNVVVEAGWSNLVVNDINNNGQIIGTGINSEGNSEVFLLSYTPDTVFTPNPIFVPIPEPETYMMLLAGLGLLGFMVRRRKETTV